MFDSLSDKLNSVFRGFSGRAQLTEANIQEGLREVRLALLEADVNFKVVKEFIERVREACLGEEVAKNLNPAQQVVKIVHDELVDLLGGDATGLNLSGKAPHVIMMVGLQGSGKTTSAGKLAHYLRAQNHRPYLVPADVYRPAAIDQLVSLAKQLDMPYYPSTVMMPPVEIAKAAVREAEVAGCDIILLDTAGRLHIDEALMQELKNLREAVKPAEILFVADAMTGQDAVTVAAAFDEALGISGVVLTKMDGDARGGAALSIKSVTGQSIKFVGVGEKVDALEPFFPDRLAGRILGMGDVLSLIEKAEETVDKEKAVEMAEKLSEGEFTLDDFRDQLKQIRQMGPLDQILGMLPNMGPLRGISQVKVDEKELVHIEAIIGSMTSKERENHQILNGSRKKRIARGCGRPVSEINQLLKQYVEARKMMRSLSRGIVPRMLRGARFPKM